MAAKGPQKPKFLNIDNLGADLYWFICCKEFQHFADLINHSYRIRYIQNGKDKQSQWYANKVIKKCLFPVNFSHYQEGRTWKVSPVLKTKLN